MIMRTELVLTHKGQYYVLKDKVVIECYDRIIEGQITAINKLSIIVVTDNNERNLILLSAMKDIHLLTADKVQVS